MSPEIEGAIIGVIGSTILWIIGVAFMKPMSKGSNGNGKVSLEQFERLRAENGVAHAEIHEKINKVSETTLVTEEAVRWIKKELENRTN